MDGVGGGTRATVRGDRAAGDCERSASAVLPAVSGTARGLWCAERVAVEEGACGRERLVHERHRGQAAAPSGRGGDVRNRFVKMEVLTGQPSDL